MFKKLPSEIGREGTELLYLLEIERQGSREGPYADDDEMET